MLDIKMNYDFGVWSKPRTTGCSLLSELFADIKHNVQYVGTLHIKLHILIYWVKESLIDVQCTVYAPILPKQYTHLQWD